MYPNLALNSILKRFDLKFNIDSTLLILFKNVNILFKLLESIEF